MNVYDFDKTIYNGDSTLDFYFYCLKSNPKIILCIPKQIFYFINYKLNLCNKTFFKEKFYCFLKHIKNVDTLIENFWIKYESKIKKFYLNNHQKTDVIISASPRFLLEPICNRLHISTLIASEVNKYTGKYTGINCYGEEKVKRFKEIFNENTNIDNFYSDSYSDKPLALISKNAFIVKKNSLEEWHI